MFLKLAHANLDVYQYSYSLTLVTYRVAKILPDIVRYNLISQIRRAALSILNTFKVLSGLIKNPNDAIQS